MYFVLVVSLILSSALALESNFYLEPKCSNINGFCVLKSECPGGLQAPHYDLCPNQKTKGAICCPTISWKDVSCKQSHNSCLEKCPKNLDLGQKECAEGKTCCVVTK